MGGSCRVCEQLMGGPETTFKAEPAHHRCVDWHLDREGRRKGVLRNITVEDVRGRVLCMNLDLEKGLPGLLDRITLLP